MSERSAPPVHAVAPQASSSDEAAVVCDAVDVTYRIYADSRPSLRRMLASGGIGAREYRAVEAVRDVSFVARQGEAIGVIGHNGSGKSTLLRAIAGLLPVSAGAVYAAATPVLLGVSAALQPELSGRRNVYLGGTALGISRARLDDAMDEIITFAGLEDFIDVPLRAYSSGMASRLQFSIATAITPDILMIDEALSVGDARFKKKSDARIRGMIDRAGTVFLVSHSLQAVSDVCSRVLWLDRGRLRGDGDPDEVIAAYERSVEAS